MCSKEIYNSIITLKISDGTINTTNTRDVISDLTVTTINFKTINQRKSRYVKWCLCLVESLGLQLNSKLCVFL